MKTKFAVIAAFLTASLTALAGWIQTGNIGIAISKRNATEPSYIALVVPHSPAARAGIKTNWFVISVNGTNVVTHPTARCMALVHGAVGTSVTLELADPQKTQTNQFTLERADVPMPDGEFIPGTNAPKPRASFLIAH